MLFPYNTDAPIYHYPVATVGLILINVIVFALVLFSDMDYETVERLCLQYGHINPIQWVTSNFLHGGILHLVGNMFFLWGFGLVVEGKLGWYRFLPIFLGIGIVQCAVEQLITLGTDGVSFGASSILYGIMAMACVWAPKNDMHCFLWMGIFSRTVELSIYTFALIFVILDVVFFALGGFNITTSALHLMGAAIGFPLGVLMLKMDWVDCEDWDLFSVWSGTEGRWKSSETPVERTREVDEESLRQQRENALELLRTHLREGRTRVALATYVKTAGEDGGGWELPAAEIAALINAMHKEKMWSESVPLMVQVLRRFPDKAAQIRLKLAQILVQAEQRPKQAIAVLSKLPNPLPAALNQRRQQIEKLAQFAIEEGDLEIEVHDW